MHFANTCAGSVGPAVIERMLSKLRIVVCAEPARSIRNKMLAGRARIAERHVVIGLPLRDASDCHVSSRVCPNYCFRKLLELDSSIRTFLKYFARDAFFLIFK